MAYNSPEFRNMCSNFGINLHPDRAPAALEQHWYSRVVRLVTYLRAKLLFNRLKMSSLERR
ncbi:MAG: hypothetical protein P4M04_13330 [Acidobacteriota bacterium]|nr:hypothetical protein [Acidobacteriota bacterium]